MNANNTSVNIIIAILIIVIAAVAGYALFAQLRAPVGPSPIPPPGGITLLTPVDGTGTPPLLPPSVPGTTTTMPSFTQLKYRLLDQFPDFFFCDPDFYPIARENEQNLALQRFPAIRENQEEFTAILKRINIVPKESFSNQEQLRIYQEHKRLAALSLEPKGEHYEFSLRVSGEQKKGAQGSAITGVIDHNGAITVVSRDNTFITCPICLAAGTLIDTPEGPVAVERLHVGVMVWTTDTAGMRVAAPIIKTGKTRVPSTHEVIHLTLTDGRKLVASPNHPTADYRRIGDLRAGDSIDGATVRSAERTPYSNGFTYDILPSGGTAAYWANGILIGSTLR